MMDSSGARPAQCPALRDEEGFISAVLDEPKVHGTWLDARTGHGCRQSQTDLAASAARKPTGTHWVKRWSFPPRSGSRWGKGQILAPGEAQSLSTRMCGLQFQTSHGARYHLQAFPLPCILVSWSVRLMA